MAKIAISCLRTFETVQRGNIVVVVILRLD